MIRSSLKNADFGEVSVQFGEGPIHLRSNATYQLDLPVSQTYVRGGQEKRRRIKQMDRSADPGEPAGYRW